MLIPHPSLMKSFHKNTKRGRTRLLWINWRKKLLFHISNSFQPSEPTASTGILYGKSQYNNLLITMFSIRLSQPCNESGSQYFCVLGVLLLQWFEGRRLYLVSLCVWPESGPEVKMYFFKASILQVIELVAVKVKTIDSLFSWLRLFPFRLTSEMVSTSCAHISNEIILSACWLRQTSSDCQHCRERNYDSFKLLLLVVLRRYEPTRPEDSKLGKPL